jgi:hypothetical protein
MPIFPRNFSPPVDQSNIKYLHVLLRQCSETTGHSSDQLKKRLKQLFQVEHISEVSYPQYLEAVSLLQSTILKNLPF